MCEMLKLTFLGAPSIIGGTEELTAHWTPKVSALLIYLATTGQLHTRDVLADLLWSELSSQQARNNLRYTLPELRNLLDDYLLITPQTIEFNRQLPYWLDVEVLRTTLTADLTTIDTPLLQNVVDLYQGDFLAGFRVRNAPVFESWVTTQQEELRTLAGQGLQRLAERYLTAADYTAGLATTQRLLALEPWHEAAHRLRMHCLALDGQPAAALSQYEQLQQLLADELGVQPSTETTALYQEIRAGTFQQAYYPHKRPLIKTITSPRRTLASVVRHNLPGQLTPFFGREEEIRALYAQLQKDDYRLITLVGEGGVGKTRLALAVAQAFYDERFTFDAAKAETVPHRETVTEHHQFPDGIWFVPLVSLAGGEDLPERLAVAIAQAMNFSFSSTLPVTKQLLTYLRTKKALLILDNFEHLVSGADFLIDLLHQAGALQLLVTSRQLLNLQAEYPWHVDGLPIPADDTCDNIDEYSSVALFVERARRVHPNFLLTATNRSAVVRICRFVHGLPLGIELAAALTKEYSCQQIYQAVTQNYAVLTTTMRDLPPRHRSIKATLDYSRQLLTPQVAQIFTCCSIFQDSFEQSAAEAITGATPAALQVLVNQSLLQQARRGADQRFAMHEFVRQYAMEQMQTQPAVLERLREQHATYYLALLARERERFVCDIVALQRMQHELDNLRLAWRWAVDHMRLDLLGQSCHALAQFYQLFSLYTEGEFTFGQAVTRIQSWRAEPLAGLLPEAAKRTSLPQTLVLAKLQVEQAHFCARLAQLDKAEKLTQAAWQAGSLLVDPMLQAQTYLCMSLIQGMRGDFTSVRAAAEQAMRYGRLAQLTEIEAAALQDLGVAFFALGDVAQGLNQLHRALAIIQQRNFYVEAGIYTNLRTCYQWTGDLHNAYYYLQQALQIHEDLNLLTPSADILNALAELLLQLGLYDLATHNAYKAQEVANALGRYDVEAYASCLLAAVAWRQGNLTLATHHCQHALQLAESYHLGQSKALAGLIQGHLWLAQAQWQAATTAYTQVQQDLAPMGHPMQRLRAQAGLAEVCLQVGERSSALAQVEELLPQIGQYEYGSAEIYEIFWISYRILAANADPRTSDILTQAYRLLSAQADRLDNITWRQSFLENVPANHALLAAAKDLDRSQKKL
ncbi:MAG: BTAD domain-containing putative transcriptional regulator [Caldilineaceae bacterium]